MLIIDKILLKLITKLIRSLKAVYSTYTADTVDIVYSKVDRIIIGFIDDVLKVAPDIVDKDLKLLNRKLLNLPLKFDRTVIEQITNKNSIFKDYGTTMSKLERDKIRRLVLSGQYNKLTDRELQRQLIEDAGLTKRKALLIARTEQQSLTSSVQHIYFNMPEVKDEYDLTWDSVLDSNTRESHAIMNGRVADEYGYFESPWGRIRGPESIPAHDHYNCRCRLVLKKK